MRRNRLYYSWTPNQFSRKAVDTKPGAVLRREKEIYSDIL
jgi:hypothetical protein